MTQRGKPGFETGLDLSDDDVISPEERKALERWYAETHGFGNLDLVPFLPFLTEQRPGSFKRWRRLAEALGGGEDGLPQAAVALLFLHYYVVVGNEKGILYEVLAAREWGAHKGEIVDTIAYAFLTSGPHGISAAADASGQYLTSWDDENGAGDTARVWPDGWKSGGAAFRTGLDYRNRDLTSAELDAVRLWHELTLGAVPHYVEFLAAHRPRVLKEVWNRYETVLAGGLPDQMAPLLTLHAAAIAGDDLGVRWAALTARRLGVRRNQLVDTLCWSLPYGGVSRFERAVGAAADVVASMS